MKKINIFCFGFGQVAKNFINRIKLEKININLGASSREKSQKKIFNEIRYDSYQFSENTFDKAIIEKLKKSVDLYPEIEEEVPANNVGGGGIAGMDGGHMSKAAQKKWTNSNKSSKKKRLRDIIGVNKT